MPLYSCTLVDHESLRITAGMIQLTDEIAGPSNGTMQDTAPRARDVAKKLSRNKESDPGELSFWVGSCGLVVKQRRPNSE